MNVVAINLFYLAVDTLMTQLKKKIAARHNNAPATLLIKSGS